MRRQPTGRRSSPLPALLWPAQWQRQRCLTKKRRRRCVPVTKAWQPGICRRRKLPKGGSGDVKIPTYVTFDCYDTLVEFDIDTATRRILGARADQIDLDAFLTEFEGLRYETTTFEPYRPYREVLRNTLAAMMERY